MEFNGNLFLEKLKKVSRKNQQQISEDIHVQPDTISRWKNHNLFPKLDTLLLIAETYNCSLDYLLGLNDENVQHHNKDNKELIDILRDMLICDMKGLCDCTLRFGSSNNAVDEQNNQYGIILFKNMYNISYDLDEEICTLANIPYAELFEKYSKMKEAFPFVDEDIRISMIDSLLKQYEYKFKCYLSGETPLPFK